MWSDLPLKLVHMAASKCSMPVSSVPIAVSPGTFIPFRFKAQAVNPSNSTIAKLPWTRASVPFGIPMVMTVPQRRIADAATPTINNGAAKWK